MKKKRRKKKKYNRLARVGAIVSAVGMACCLLFVTGLNHERAVAVKLTQSDEGSEELLSDRLKEEEMETDLSQTALADEKDVEIVLSGNGTSEDTVVHAVTVRSVEEAEKEKTPLEQYFEDHAVVNKELVESALNVRSNPSEEAEIVNTLAGDTILVTGERKNGWLYIEDEELSGWVNASYLLTGTDAAEYVETNADAYAQVTVDSVNIRLGKSTSSAIIDTAEFGDAFPLVSIEDGWACIELGDVLCGYLAGNCVTVNYDWNGLVIETKVSGAADDEVKDLSGTWDAISSSVAETLPQPETFGSSENPKEEQEMPAAETSEPSLLPETPSAAFGETLPESSENLTPVSTPAVSSEIPDASENPPIDPSVQGTAPSETPAAESSVQETAPVETPAAESSVQETEPSGNNPASDPSQQGSGSSETPEDISSLPEAESSSESIPETPAAPVLGGIEAFYIGAAQKTEGEVVCSNEICVYLYYSDGSIAVTYDGWTCAGIGMILSAGENILTVNYGGFSSNIVLNVLAAPTLPSETETLPAATLPETQPAAETVPSSEAPAETLPAETTVPETTAPAAEAYVNNVDLSPALTAYALSLCSAYGLDSSVVFSVMYQESHFNPSVTSKSGAEGLMQIIPRYSLDRMARLGVTDLYDAASNMLVGIDMLAEFYYTYGGWVPALTQYRYGTPNGPSDYASLILSRVYMFQ